MVRYLFVKQVPKYMRDDDMLMLSESKQSEPVKTEEHQDQLELSEKYLSIVVDTMRYYLG